MAKNYFNRYVWLIDLIYRRGHITMDEINEQWSRSSLNDMHEKCIPERTFFNHRNAIEEVFGIRIKCSRQLGYYIENSDDVMGSGLKQWMMQSLSLNNLANETSDLKERIVMDDVPSSQKWLADMIHAMRDGFKLEMTYQSFKKNEPSTFVFEPYCLRLFKLRWYVLGKSEHYDYPRMYALDRVHGVSLTQEKFSLPDDFDAAGYFSNFYGASVNQEWEPSDVLIKVDARQAKYIRTLPIHHSQKEVMLDDEYSLFSFHLVPTFEFERELLSHGRHIEVLEPQWLRDGIADEVKDMAKSYGII